MEKIKIKWGQNHSTAQIYDSGPELALCSDDNQQIGTFVFCKDFFQDAILASLHGSNASIYSYTYVSGQSPPIPTKNIKVLLSNAKDKDILTKGEAVLDFIHQFEEAISAKTPIVKSQMWEIEDQNEKYKFGSFLISGDPIWLLAPPLISGWTLLVRTGLQHTVGVHWEKTVQDIIDKKILPAQKNDHVYLTHGLPGLKFIIEQGIEACFGKDQKSNYPKEKAGNSMHHYSGIVSYGSKKSQAHFPNWKYPEVSSEPPRICFA